MESAIVISTRGLGRRKKLLDDWSIPYPPDLGEGGDRLTLRDLITRVVVAEVAAFKRRQHQRKFIRVLTEREIDAAAEKGKIDMGGRDLEQKVDVDQAVAGALQAFDDGLYLVSVDGHQQRDLDAEVFLQPGSRVTFIRLVMLAGA
jgi:hypothetical protein